jgi:stalled ribosome alternative rescue factor ArfA
MAPENEKKKKGKASLPKKEEKGEDHGLQMSTRMLTLFVVAVEQPKKSKSSDTATAPKKRKGASFGCSFTNIFILTDIHSH